MPEFIFNKVKNYSANGLGRLLQQDKTLKYIGEKILTSIDSEEDSKGRKTSPDELYSIPSPWGRALVFHAAFIDPEHSAHEDVISEWRGILALLCFLHDKKLVHEPIAFTKIALDSNSSERAVNIISQMKEGIWPDEKLCVIENVTEPEDTKYIGALSPYTLVFSSAKKYKADVKWYNESIHRLQDPTKGDYLDDFDKIKLTAWINIIVKNLHAILESLRLFQRSKKIESISARQRKAWFDRWNEWRDDVEDIIFIYNSIAEELKKWKLEINAVDVPEEYGALALRDEILLPYRDFISPFDPEGKKIDNKVELELNFESVSETNSNVSDPFSDRIVILSKETKVNSYKDQFTTRLANTDIGRKAFIPLKESLFKGTTNKRAELTLYEETGDSIFAEIKIGDFYFEKVFDKTQKIELQSETLLEVWPNFKADDWHLYYFLFTNKLSSNPDRLTCHYNFTSKSSNISKPETEKTNAALHEFNDDRFGNVQVYYSDNFPEVLELKYDGIYTAGVIKINDIEFVPEQTADHQTPDHWDGRVAFDFGTSNTMIVAGYGDSSENEKYDQQKIDFTTLSPFKVFGTVMANDKERENLLTKCFFPDNIFIPSTGLSTIIKETIQVSSGKDLAKDSPENLFGNYYIPFIYGFQSFSELFMESQTLREGLKWDIEDNDVGVRIYIFQMLLLIAAYAVRDNKKKIELIWSYPGSFTETQLTNFKTILNNVFKIITDNTGISIDRKWIKESDAVYGFLKAQSSENVLYIGADIGGGSTDLAVFSQSDLNGICSLRFAGNNIVQSMLNNRKIKEFIINNMRVLSGHKNEYETYIHGRTTGRLFITLLLKNEFDEFAERILNNYSIEEVKRIRTLCFYLISSIAFYSGMLVSKVDFENEGVIQQVILHYLGNGSNFYNLITSNTSQESKEKVKRIIEDFVLLGFRAVERNATEPIRNISFKVALPNFSDKDRNDLKQEVAKGALRLSGDDLELLNRSEDLKTAVGDSNETFMDNEVRKMENRRTLVICGEMDASSGSKSLNATDEMTFDVWKDLKIENYNIFKKYLDSVSKASRLLLLESLSEDDIVRILNNMKNSVSAIKVKSQKSVRQDKAEMKNYLDGYYADSPFIIGVRSLIDSLNILE